MKEEQTTMLRKRRIKDMRIRGTSPKTQPAYFRPIGFFAEFIGRARVRPAPPTSTAKRLSH